MILAIECEVDSDTSLEDEIKYKLNSSLIILSPNKLKCLGKITIQKPFPDYRKFLPTINSTPGEIPEIVLPKDYFFDEQIKFMQFFESFSAVDLGVRKVKWEEPYIMWVPENEAEKELIKISGYSYRESFPVNNKRLSKGWLEQTIQNRNMVIHLTELLSFYRLGSNFYFDKLYIISFLHFFLVLEGAFGNGKTDKKQTIGAFMKAEHLLSAVSEIILAINQSGQEKHRDWFNNYHFKHTVIESDPVRKMINILYDHRGLFSHYSMASYRKRNDFDQNAYQSIAFVAMIICRNAIDKLRLDPFSRLKQKKDRLN